MAKDTIEVVALKPFALGGSEHMPGRVKVPAKSIPNLVEKGFIEAPEQPSEESSLPLISQEEVDEVTAGYLSSTFGLERFSGESPSAFIAGVIGEGRDAKNELLGIDNLLKGRDALESLPTREAKIQKTLAVAKESDGLKTQLTEAKAAAAKAKTDLTNVTKERDGFKSELDKVKAELEALKAASAKATN
ncbi:hypothetical protein EON83_12570 [bacterium]|nr:MAG: hypothetical protein EON83_12570 [bacterium]